MAQKDLKFSDETLLELLKQRHTLYEIMDILGVCKSTVARRMKKLGVSTFDYKLDITVFDSIDTEEKAYWLGFMFADGYVSKRYTVSLTLKESDRSHVERFARFFNIRKIHIGKGTAKLNNKEYKYCRWSIQNKHLHDTLCSLGCVQNKSLILKFPKKEIFKDQKLIYDFIRGYVDGDGCLWLNKQDTLILEIMGTTEFLKELQSYFPNKFTFGHKDKRRPNSNTYRLIACSQNAKDVTNKLYKNATIYLERKYLKYKIGVS